MSISLFTGLLIWEPAYQPRHRSTRPARDGSGGLAQAERGTRSRRRASRPEPGGSCGTIPQSAALANAPAESAKEADALWAERRVFPGRDDQVAEARRFVRRALDGYPVVDDAVLCVSELATNTLLHTASGNGGQFEIIVWRSESSVRIAVSDNGSIGKPAICAVDAASEQGRGLGLVALVASHWGESGDESGRTVWFELC